VQAILTGRVLLRAGGARHSLRAGPHPRTRRLRPSGRRIGSRLPPPGTDADASPRPSTWLGTTLSLSKGRMRLSSARHTAPARLPRWGPRHSRRRSSRPAERAGRFIPHEFRACCKQRRMLTLCECPFGRPRDNPRRGIRASWRRKRPHYMPNMGEVLDASWWRRLRAVKRPSRLGRDADKREVAPPADAAREPVGSAGGDRYPPRDRARAQVVSAGNREPTPGMRAALSTPA
jgi:hypothetical protein